MSSKYRSIEEHGKTDFVDYFLTNLWKNIIYEKNETKIAWFEYW